MSEREDREERDESGLLTAWALAHDALEDHGCDCGTDEPGTCLVCHCERALRVERLRAGMAERALAAADGPVGRGHHEEPSMNPYQLVFLGGTEPQWVCGECHTSARSEADATRCCERKPEQPPPVCAECQRRLDEEREP